MAKYIADDIITSVVKNLSGSANWRALRTLVLEGFRLA